MKILLAGTPEFSVKAFEEVINNFDVVGIITQPDRASGRGHKLKPSPVKELAIKYNIKTYQPDRIKNIFDELKELDFDVLLTCAFGQLIPDNILALPKVAALNIHASLLPKYRGAAPIHYAVLNGESKTGISLMYMVKKMDAGDVLFQAGTKISKKENTGDLFNKLSELASNNIKEWLNKIEQGEFEAIKQKENLITLSPKISKAECEVRISNTLFEAQRKIRAFTPFPGAYIMLNNIKYKVADYDHEKGIPFKVKDGTLFINKIQAPNKKMMDYKEFLKGNKL